MSIPLNQAIESYLQSLPALNRSEKTIKSYQCVLGMFNSYLSRKHNYQIYVDEVNFDCMEEYMAHLHNEKGYSPSSRNAFLAIAKLFFEYCIKCNLCSDNPALQIGKIRQARNERIFLTEEEFEAFTDCIGHPVSKLLAQTLYYTGLRISECLRLRLQDVDLEEQLVHVRFAKGCRYRAIPINDKLLVLLSDYIANTRPDVGVELLFVTKYGKFSTRHFERWLRKAEMESGIGKHVTAHVFRHSFATALIRKGVEISKVQHLLGHCSVQTTTIYIHSNIQALHKAVNLL